MDNLKLSNRIAPLFAQQHARHAMYMAGSAVVSCYLGAPLPELLEALHHGLGLALSHAPFAPTIEAVSNYFGGALTYLGSVGLGVADWVEAAGGEIGQRSRDVLSAMGHFFGDRVDSAKSYFDMAIANTAEFAALWRGTIKESILGDPQALLDRACNVVTRIGEVFAVVAGIKESYSWVCRKFLGRRAKPENAEPTTITNLHINISLMGQQGAQNAQEAVEKVAEHLSEAGAARAEKSCGRPISWGSELNSTSLNSSQVLWVSRAFNEELRETVMRRMASSMTVAEHQKVSRRAKRIFQPIQGIEGGLIYEVSPKGDLSCRQSETAKNEDNLREYECHLS